MTFTLNPADLEPIAEQIAAKLAPLLGQSADPAPTALMLRVEEAAPLLHSDVTTAQLRGFIQTHALPVRRIGNTDFIAREHLLAFARSEALRPIGVNPDGSEKPLNVFIRELQEAA